jgi:hypothetical protein
MKARTLIVIGLCGLLLAGCNLIQMVKEGQEADAVTEETQTEVAKTSSQAPLSPADAAELLQAEDFEYLGAFRLPGGEDCPLTFAYGGNAMTFNPDGDPDGASDGFEGSLFVMGHDRIAYGDVPDGNQVAEVDIPVPVVEQNIEALNTAGFLQDFENVAKGHFTSLEEIPRVGMAYLNRPETGPLIHITWGAHLQTAEEASQAWFSPNLRKADIQGFWYLDDLDPYSVTGYLFEIPQAWADAYTGGRVLASGRYRDGGQGGMGPALFAYTPWLADGSPSADGTHLSEVPLLLYENAYNTETFERCLSGYSHADEWEGGAWLTTADGSSAVLFAGTKATGEKTWYGYVNPEGADQVCVDRHITDYPTCRTADGGICQASDLKGCCDEEAGACASNRGWWSSRFDAQLILYNPDDLAKVAAGTMESWQPQPYAVLDIDEHLFLSPPEWDVITVGSGDQRRFRIGDVAFDREHGLLYVLELYADGAKPVVHVWRVN